MHFLNWIEFPDYRFVSKDKVDLSKYPKLQALEKRTENHPKVAEWIAKRPEGP